MTSCGPAGCRLLNGGGQRERSVVGGCRCGPAPQGNTKCFEFSIFEIALLKQGSSVRCLATASDARGEIRRTGAGNEQDKKNTSDCQKRNSCFVAEETGVCTYLRAFGSSFDSESPALFLPNFNVKEVTGEQKAEYNLEALLSVFCTIFTYF